MEFAISLQCSLIIKPIKKFNYEEKIKVGTFKICFITSGDLVKRGVYNFIDAIEVFIKKHNFDMKVIIIGKAGKMIKELKKIISNKQLENIIEFIESNDKIEEYYKNIDLMVHPALFEEFGLVVQEAIVCGTPVLTSKMVGASELVEIGNENIFLMENSSKDEIIKGLEYFLLDSGNLKKWNTIAKNIFKDNTEEKYNEKIKKIIYSI